MKEKVARRAVSLALAGLVAAGCALPALAAPEADPGKAVIDNADVLTADTENYITELDLALQERCGAQIGVYTVDTIGNYTMEGYTRDLANAWGLGDADLDNGIVLVMAIGEDDYRAMCGAGLERQFTVAMLQDVLNENLEPAWQDGDYDTGTRDTVRAMADTLCTIYGININLDDPAASASGTVATPARGPSVNWAGVVALVVVIAVVALVLFAPRGPGGPGGPRFIFLGGWGRPWRPRPPRPPRPPRRPPPPPRGPGGYGGFGGPRPGGGFRTGGGSFRGGGAGRMGGRSFGGGSFGGGAGRSGGFRTGGGSFRGGGAGRR